MRKEPNARLRLEGWLKRTIHEHGGGYRIVQFLIPHGKSTLQFLQSTLEPEEQTSVARGQRAGGEGHVLFHAARAGQLPWITWMCRHGANLSWRDHLGHNLAAHLFRVQDLVNEIDDLPIGKRNQDRISRLANTWLEQQEAVYQWIRAQADETFWQQRSMGGSSMEEICGKQREKAYQRVWELAPGLRQELLKTHVAGAGAATTKPRM